MKTVAIECKKFKEWDKETQKKIIDVHRDINTEYEDWHEHILDEWKEKIKALGFYNIEIAYTGFWSQGDGASFTGNVDVSEWLAVNYPDKYQWEIDLLDDGVITISYNKFIRSCHYYHEKSTSLHLNWEINYSEIPNCIEPAMSEIEKLIEEHHINLNKEIYKALEDEYEYLSSDEEVIETLVANAYEFDKKGKIW